MITVKSAVLVGIEAFPVTITAETSMSPGGIMITGISPAAMRETRVRVKSSLAQCGIEAGDVDVTVTPEVATGPAGNAGSLDLAIALAIAALRHKTGSLRYDVTFIGELSLIGKIHPVRGAVAHARAAGTGHILVPAANSVDAAVTDAQVIYASTLDEVISGGVQGQRGVRFPSHTLNPANHDEIMDISDLHSATVRRALEISAAGRHPLLLVGGPGSGKTAAARRLAALMPNLTADEALDVLTIHDAAGLRGQPGQPSVCRPFRAPHHTVSETGLLGGGDSPRPGEVTLAHHGVLFLDEVHEFRKSVLESLGHVLAEGKVTLRRTATMPAVPLLVGATNKCECGPTSVGFVTECKCTPERLKRFRDRAQSYEALFAMRVEVPDVRLAGVTSGRSSSDNNASVRARVEAARKIIARSPGAPFVPSRSIPTISAEAQRLFDTKALHGTWVRDVLNVARTIAALDDKDMISEAHMAEALSLRSRP